MLAWIWKIELKDLIEKHISDIKQPYVPDFGQVEDIEFDGEQKQSWSIIQDYMSKHPKY